MLFRNGYTILDLMSDIGGMQWILLSFFAILMGVFNFNHFDNYLASRLYKIIDPGSVK